MITQSMVQQMSQSGQMTPMMPHGDTGTSTALLWVIIFLLTIIIIYLWYTGGKKHKEPLKSASNLEITETDKIDVALRLLNDHEKHIVQALIDHGGEMLQKDITYELELTRVQTHRSIQSLRERDIVTTEDYYNTKKITLSEWLIH